MISLFEQELIQSVKNRFSQFLSLVQKVRFPASFHSPLTEAMLRLLGAF